MLDLNLKGLTGLQIKKNDVTVPCNKRKNVLKKWLYWRVIKYIEYGLFNQKVFIRWIKDENCPHIFFSKILKNLHFALSLKYLQYNSFEKNYIKDQTRE